MGLPQKIKNRSGKALLSFIGMLVMFAASALAGYYLVGPRVVGNGNEEQVTTSEDVQPETDSQVAGARRDGPRAVPRLNIAISEEAPVDAPRPKRSSHPRPAASKPASAESAGKTNNSASDSKPPDQLFRVQVGVFSDEQAANQATSQLRAKGEQVHVTRSQVDGKEVFNVQAGLYTQKENADRHAKQLQGKGVNSSVTEIEQKVQEPKPAEQTAEPQETEAE